MLQEAIDKVESKIEQCISESSHEMFDVVELMNASKELIGMIKGKIVNKDEKDEADDNQ